MHVKTWFFKEESGNLSLFREIDRGVYPYDTSTNLEWGDYIQITGDSDKIPMVSMVNANEKTGGNIRVKLFEPVK